MVQVHVHVHNKCSATQGLHKYQYGSIPTYERYVHKTHLAKERNHAQSSAPGGAGLGGYPHILVRHFPWVRLR